MKLRVTFFIGFSLFLLMPQLILAQIPTIPTSIDSDVVEAPPDCLEQLGDYYKIGQWKELQDEVKKLLMKCKWQKPDIPKSEVPEYDFEKGKNYYSVVFLGKGFDGKAKIIRFLWHNSSLEPYVNRVPGLSKLYEVILSYEKSDMEFRTAYLSSRKENAMVAQIPKIAKQLEPLLFVKLPGMTKAPGEVPPKPKKICVEVREVAIPYKRATIQIKDTVIAKNALLVAKINKTSQILADDFSKREAYGNRFGKKLIEELKRGLRAVTCKDEDDFTEKYTASIKTAYENFIGTYGAINQEDLKLGIFIEQSFMEMVKETSPETITAEVEINNVPYESISFGLISSFMLSKNYNCDNRVKISDAGMYVNDPLKNPLTAAIINFHPLRYDPEAIKISWQERFRLFFGEVLTPEIGLCAGAGIAIIRGLTINAGAALLVINSPKNPVSVLEEGKEIGTKPQNKNDPFTMKGGWVFFIGFGYSFQ